MVGRTISFEHAARYRIAVHGTVNANWSDRLAGMVITHVTSGEHEPVTLLTGKVSDQAELIGVLNTLYERHLPLLMVQHLV